MKLQHEVIVVGAGPAGSMTALILAQQGHDVLLLDRAAFPRDKTCGDAIPMGAVEMMNKYGMQGKVETAVADGRFYPLNSLLIASPRNYEIRAALIPGQDGASAHVAPRIYLDHLLQQHAIDCGAQFQVGQVKEPIVEQGVVRGIRARIDGVAKELRAKLVIGADGVTSAIARHLRPKQAQHLDQHRAVAIRAYIEGLSEYAHEVEFYLYKAILPGYAWVFPTGKEQANIGLGMRLDHYRQYGHNLETMLKQFLQMPAIKARLRPCWQLRDTAIWQLNFGSQPRLQHAFDGALLVGDAAGFINPITGGGIHNSMISAELAAQVASQSLQANDFSYQALQVYERLCHSNLWESMRSSYRMQQSFIRFPWLVDILVRFGRQSHTLTQTFLDKL